MMKTRKKSKAAANAAAAASSSSTAPPTPVEPQISVASTRENSPLREMGVVGLSVTLPDDIDYNTLSSLLPEVALTAPTGETIVSLYRFVLAQVAATDVAQREVEEVHAQMERKDIELDQALQDKESAVAETESALESMREELTTVKQENSELGTCIFKLSSFFVCSRF